MTARPLTPMERARQLAETLGQRTTISTPATNGTPRPATIPATPPAMVDHALKLARRGFHVFPIQSGAKKPPLIPDFPNQASRDEDQIRERWAQWPNANTGNSTTHYGDNEALLVVDCDGPDGAANWARLQEQHGTAPETFTVKTPRGEHRYYTVPNAVKQSAGKLAPHVDIRSQGGYVVAPGSVVEGKPYTVLHDRAMAPAPAWLIALCGEAKEKTAVPAGPSPSINQTSAAARVVEYLKTAPLAIEGSSGDDTTFKVACRVKDLGVDEAMGFQLMAEHWNPRCQPPWSDADLLEKVRNAYHYGKDPVGVAAPEVEFQPVAEAPDAPLHPFENINREWAFVMQGGAHILWETTDAQNRPLVKHVPIPAFHAKFANQKMTIDTRTKPISVHWMESKERRSYDGVVFMPERSAPARFFNLWSGYTCEPAAPGVSHEAVDLWKSHLLKNVCGGSATQFHWVMAYFAQLIQRPWQKPRIALVFRGAKGVGKNALIERVAALLGRHAMVTADRRYVDGNFNGHLEHCLLLVVDEAFWSGDRTIEGTLKNLITGREHIIEHKGCEPYPAQNLTRVVIMGNEEWLVPASNDERRYAVFDVGDGQKQDSQFFHRMIDGMDHGGYPVLLRTLLDVDVDLVDLDHAPLTPGLLEQKEHSLSPLEGWWSGCLQAGRIVGVEWSGWPEEVDCERFRLALKQHATDRNIATRIPADNAIGRLMKKFAPGFDRTRGKEVDGIRRRAYRLPGLEEARRGWDKYMGQEIIWSD